MAVVSYMLTTIDNPNNPFTEFNKWLQEDLSKGYNTLGLLADKAFTSNDLSDEDNIRITNEAIDEIVIEKAISNGLLLDSDSSIKEEDLIWYKKVKEL